MDTEDLHGVYMQCSRTVLLFIVCYSKHCVWYGLLFVVAQAVWYWVWPSDLSHIVLTVHFSQWCGVQEPVCSALWRAIHHSSASDDNLATSQCLSSALSCPFYTAWCREHPSLIRTISYCIGNMLRKSIEGMYPRSTLISLGSNIALFTTKLLWDNAKHVWPSISHREYR